MTNLRFRPLIGVIISNLGVFHLRNKGQAVSVPLSGLSFLILLILRSSIGLHLFPSPYRGYHF